MRRKPTRTLICFILTAVMLFGSIMGMSSCMSMSLMEGESEITNTVINEYGELIVYFSDGSSKNAGKIENNSTTVNVAGDAGDVSSATAKGLMSAVSIASNYSRGSGVIYSLEGDEALIITNHHVVSDSTGRESGGISRSIYVFLYGREDDKYAIPAEYGGGSAYYDIAVLYAKNTAFTSGAVCAAEISTGDVSVGESAIAIGNPRGYGISASLGIVSVDSEYIVTTANSASVRVIRVDTAVNSGNSGGGLYNDKGELIGIVNAKIVDENVENIGYAIPASVVSGVANNIVKSCLGTSETSVQRAFLGITLSTDSVCTKIGEDGNIDIVETVSAKSIEKGSLCYGVVKPGDILLSASIGDRSIEISRTHHIIDFMLNAVVGDTVTLTVNRSGEILTMRVTVTAASVVER